MADDVLRGLPIRSGHFLLESGYHSELWLTLDELFVDATVAAPLVVRLAEQLEKHEPDAICGPLMGGAFLAQSVAAELGALFYYTEPIRTRGTGGDLFAADYQLPVALARAARGRAVAVVDDVISAGSSVRASIAALEAAGASTAAVGALAVLGDVGAEHFGKRGIPVEALDRKRFSMWRPSECPLCRAGTPLEDPLA